MGQGQAKFSANDAADCESNANPASIRLALILIGTVALLSGCAGAGSWQQTTTPTTHVRTANFSHPAVTKALGMVGKPYRYGAKGPDSFDCSGLVWYSFKHAGITVPRTSAQQYAATQRVSLADARPGDLLFFGSRRDVSHVAIYLGNNQFVHAPSSGKRVSVADMSASWYQKNFVAAGRLPGM